MWAPGVLTGAATRFKWVLRRGYWISAFKRYEWKNTMTTTDLSKEEETTEIIILKSLLD